MPLVRDACSMKGAEACIAQHEIAPVLAPKPPLLLCYPLPQRRQTYMSALVSFVSQAATRCKTFGMARRQNFERLPAGRPGAGDRRAAETDSRAPAGCSRRPPCTPCRSASGVAGSTGAGRFRTGTDSPVRSDSSIARSHRTRGPRGGHVYPEPPRSPEAAPAEPRGARSRLRPPSSACGGWLSRPRRSRSPRRPRLSRRGRRTGRAGRRGSVPARRAPGASG